MFRKLSILSVIFLLTVLAGQPAMADFWGSGAPDWSSNTYYTNQTWAFTDEVDFDNTGGPGSALIMPPVSADAGYSNGYTAAGTMAPINYPALYQTSWTTTMEGAWDWVDEGPMGADWIGLQGMIGGMGQGSLDIYAPIADVAGLTNVWLQYVSYIPNGSSGANVGAGLAFDSAITNPSGSASKNYEQITALDGQGGSGDWWLITEEWQLADAGDLLFLRINADVPGTSNMIDSVQLMTSASAVPIPGAVWLMGTGLIGLVGIRRRNS
ncbi:MAG: VPLPA-CTERM sorting domain-containing protein [Pseudomonadota bacterium]